MTRPRLLVVDDKPSFLSLFEKLVGDRFEVRTAASAEKALGLLAVFPFDVVVTDVRMPGMDGLQLLREIKRVAPAVEVMLITGYGTIAQAVDAMKVGAFDYLTKPFDPDEALAKLLAAAERRRSQRDTPGASASAASEAIAARSDVMLRTLDLARRAATTNLPVLLIGEPGVGKRRIARLIHDLSTQSERPFTSVSARDLDPNIYPDHGTAYVFELELASTRTQQLWLERVAAKRGPRWIAGTSEPTDDLVAELRLREDLVQALSEMPIAVPALRDRQEDIPLLVSQLLDQRRQGDRRPFTPEALAALVAYDWPGNLRQLTSVVEQVLRESTTPRVGWASLPDEITRTPSLTADPARLVELSYREVLDLSKDRTTRDYLIQLLRVAKGNVTRAAQRAEVERESLHRLMRRYHLRAEDFRDEDR